MVRTQIQLTEEQASALRKLSAREGKSMAEVIRGSLEQRLRAEGVVDRDAAVRRALGVIGRFHSGLENLAAEHDRYLAESLSE